MKRFAVLLTCVALGCGSKAPPMSEPAKSMAKKFEQQMTNRKTVVFKQLCEEVEKMHKGKQLTDAEQAALHKVCGPAKEGQWDRAEAALKPLLDAANRDK